MFIFNFLKRIKKEKKNERNSTQIVSCYAPGICARRFTYACSNCDYNKGYERNPDYFKPKCYEKL